MRPTGRLHIGHYFGALENWVRLQNDPEYDCFYFVADWHALTSDYADTSAVAQNTIEIVTDYLAAGLDPEKAVLFQQSQVPEHAELHLLLSMVTPLGLIAAGYRLLFQKLLARPFLMVAMVFLAAAVSLRFFRFGGVQKMVLSGVAAGFLLYVLSKVTEDLSKADLMHPVTAAWLPVLAGGLTGFIALLYQEDG